MCRLVIIQSEFGGESGISKSCLAFMVLLSPLLSSPQEPGCVGRSWPQLFRRRLLARLSHGSVQSAEPRAVPQHAQPHHGHDNEHPAIGASERTQQECKAEFRGFLSLFLHLFWTYCTFNRASLTNMSLKSQNHRIPQVLHKNETSHCLGLFRINCVTRLHTHSDA